MDLWEVVCLSNIRDLFFTELKQYNGTNFRTLRDADLTDTTPDVLKAFSSTLTRYFIFAEKHPDISDVEMRLLYFQLKLDMVARCFANYPVGSLDELKPFQLELQAYVLENKSEKAS